MSDWPSSSVIGWTSQPVKSTGFLFREGGETPWAPGMTASDETICARTSSMPGSICTRPSCDHEALDLISVSDCAMSDTFSITCEPGNDPEEDGPARSSASSASHCSSSFSARVLWSKAVW
eukprot:9686292-Alexandrium_andersonii.AAC.1